AQTDQVAEAAPGSTPEFAECDRSQVVLDEHRQPEGRGDPLPDLDMVPVANERVPERDASFRIASPGHAQAEAQHIAPAPATPAGTRWLARAEDSLGRRGGRAGAAALPRRPLREAHGHGHDRAGIEANADEPPPPGIQLEEHRRAAQAPRRGLRLDEISALN